MPNYTVSQDIDDFMKSDDDSAARTELGLGSAATSNTGDFATSIQGGKADTALQSGDNVSTLTNDAGYLTTAPVAPVDSVNTQTGAVVLDADDISDATTTNKFATQAQLDNADSALQSGDNITELANNAGYITSVPVDSVNTQTGAVVLDADDIDDSLTTNKFATQAQLDNADSALQSGDNITELANNAGYITSAPVDSVNGNTGTVVLDADDIDDSLTTHKFATQAQLEKADSALQSADIDTLAELNAILTDANLDDVSSSRTPTAHTHPLTDLTQSSATDGQIIAWNNTASEWQAASKDAFIGIACSDETTDLATGVVATFRLPHAMTLTAIRASVTTAPVGSNIIVDVKEGGVSVMTTNLVNIDNGDKTSVGSATTANITDTNLADDAEITIEITQVGSTTAGAGLKLNLIGTKA